MIQIKNLKHTIGDATILDLSNFSIQRGEILGLIGESGAGKSTLGKILAKILKPSAGEIYFEKTNYVLIPRITFAKQVQMVFQDPSLSLNPLHKISTILKEPHLIHNTTHQTHFILEQMNLPLEILNKYPHDLSGGEKQKIAIARAMNCFPALLICDEIFASLDKDSANNIKKLLREAHTKTKATIILISHDLKSLYELCDKIAVMKDGQIIEESDSESFFRNPQHPYSKELLQIAKDGILPILDHI